MGVKEWSENGVGWVCGEWVCGSGVGVKEWSECDGVECWLCSRVWLASFPGRFGREKRPGNFHEFKLLLPLPESWKNQSDFRSLSHDNSKPICVKH